MAQPRYSFEDDLGERQPLGRPLPKTPRRLPQQPRYPPQQQQYQQVYQEQDIYPPSPSRAGPGVHPDSSFGRMRAQRRLSQEGPPSPIHRGNSGGRGPGPYEVIPAGTANYRSIEMTSPISPPQPPPHRDAEGRYWGQEGYTPAQRPIQNTTTPGADNFGEAAAGGMAGIALSVAEHNARESGLEAVRGPDYPQQAYQQHGQWANQGQGRSEAGMRGSSAGDYPQPQVPYVSSGYVNDRDSQVSLQGLSSAARSPGIATPGHRTPSRSPHPSFTNEVYTDDPYNNLSRHQDPRLGAVDPHDIEDDGDDGLDYHRRVHRTSMLSLGSSHRGREGGSVAGGAAGGAVAGGVIAGLTAKNASSSGLSSQYAPVRDESTAYEGSGPSGLGVEKPGWQSPGHASPPKSRKWRLIIILVVGLLIIVGVVLGTVLGLVNKKGDPATGQAAAADDAKGDLDINSAEIKALMSNPDLHKVFPGMDYTPLNTQYPECLHYPPSQNNITRDVAVLSRLTNTLKLYGTDCNQTQMVIHSIKQLKLEDTVKVWMGVWQDNNATTNERQLSQMWDILDEYGDKHFKGVVVANEILFREQMTVDELGLLLGEVRTNLTAKGMSLPVATSDLGDKWTAGLAAKSDYIMANIHPFFGGINAKDAAGWTWSFWNNHNVGFFKADNDRNIISETGWPSQGGTDCGSATVKTCPDASVAGISQLNQFMDDWVCGALTNGTQYFWFEAFDEPWKIRFNSDNQNWEDHWGLMDIDRKLKDGVKIPDCGGKTIP